MKKSKATVLIGLGVLLGFAIGFLVGHGKGAFRAALDENKIATINLRFNAEHLSPQLREYLKARVYGNVLARYPNDPGYLHRTDWDFGLVDRAVLENLATYKDFHHPDSWEEAVANKSRHERDTER